MALDPKSKEKPLRSPVIEGLRAVVFTGLTALPLMAVFDAVTTGRTIFPIRRNRTYVTFADDTAWFLVSLSAWLLMLGFMGWIALKCWRRMILARAQ